MARLRILPGRERDVTPGAAALPPVTGSPPRHRPDLARRANSLTQPGRAMALT